MKKRWKKKRPLEPIINSIKEELHKYGKYGHKPNDLKYPKFKKEQTKRKKSQ